MSTIKLNPKINFFAKPDELLTWAHTWTKTYGLFCALTRNLPSFSVLQNIAWEEKQPATQLFSEYNSLLLRLHPIRADVPTVNHLHSPNPGMLYVNLPRLTSKGLRFGMFGTGTKDREALKVWQEIGKDFLNRTTAGLWVLFTPACRVRKSFCPEYRYSAGAAELWRSGVLLVGSGNDTWHLEEPLVDDAD